MADPFTGAAAPARGAAKTPLVHSPAPGQAGLVDAAARDLRRQAFLREFNEKMDALQSDPEAWADYEAEAELTSVCDGVG